MPFYRLLDRVGIDTDVLTKDMIKGFHFSHAAWNDVDELRTKLRWQCRELFGSIDVLLTPAAPVAAFPHQTDGNVVTRHLTVNGAKRPYLDHVPWIALATTAHLPATTAPIGLTPEGLPVGIQIVGP